MKVFVVGATGRVGQVLIEKLLERGHQVVAGARKPGQIRPESGVTPVSVDLLSSIQELSQLVAGSDAVLFVAGSRGRDLLNVDAYGAVKMMQATEMAGIKRFILLSALYSLQPEHWVDSLREYYIAKYFADLYLIDHTELDYTIVQPGNLVETTGSGRISFHASESTSISIEDVAESIAALLPAIQSYKRVIELHPGNGLIDQVVADL